MKTSTNRNQSENRREKTRWTNPNRMKFLYLINILILCAVTLVSLVAGAVFLRGQILAQEETAQLQAELDALEGEDKTLYTAEELEEAEAAAWEEGAEEERNQLLMEIQSSMESGGSTASMLRSLFSDDIVVVSGGKYYFYPVIDELEKNEWSSEDFTLGEDGRLSYSGTGSIRMQTGVSISDADGEIDWSAVAEDDISFVMLEVGQRLIADADDGEAGDIVVQELTADNAADASAAGLSVGAFWTLGAVTEEEVQEEAETLIEILSEMKVSLSMPVAVCVNVPSETDRTAEQTRDDRTAYVTLFCETLEEAGYQPMIYGNLASFVMTLDLEALESYGWSRWISNAGASLYFPYEFSLWEYSTAGAVQGISTEVRLNAYF